ncbi:MAG: RluA family pseudouridine synthase [Candidatus Shikimatogenerans bostrichidophilus]|nr:MAG: RluA family pseudouridine synthase [Candidatus Shikimatogenerans bostrichidophilus]
MKKNIYIKNKILSKKIRIDKYLYIFFFKKKISRNKIQIDIYNKNILLNDKTTKKNKILKNNDKITIIYNTNTKDIHSNNILNIKIHYEDKNIIVINKKPGQVVHPGYGNYNNTLINWLKYYINNQHIYNDFNYTSYRYGLLHRLDKDTSGLLIIAKNIPTFYYIKKQFITKTIKKKYYALIWGIPKNKKDIIKNYIGRNKKNRIKMMVMNNNKKKYGKFSITKYIILKTFKIFSLIKCKLKTGRTHQIRVHFKYIGHPIFNDKLYGGNKIPKQYIKKYKHNINYLFKILPRHALHAYYLSYKDPITKNYKTLISKLPKDMTNGIKYLKNKL